MLAGPGGGCADGGAAVSDADGESILYSTGIFADTDAVAVDDPEYQSVQEARELPAHKLSMLQRFFQDYKTLEGKTVEVDDLQPAAAAKPIIEEALERYSEQRRRGFPKK